MKVIPQLHSSCGPQRKIGNFCLTRAFQRSFALFRFQCDRFAGCVTFDSFSPTGRCFWDRSEEQTMRERSCAYLHTVHTELVSNRVT